LKLGSANDSSEKGLLECRNSLSEKKVLVRQVFR